MSDTIVIDGEVELLNVIDGDPEVIIVEGGGVTPSGTIEITENGTYNVTEYANADVDVQGGITPTGTKQINIASNGTTTEDVTNYASAEITTNVPASAVDTGTKSISSNGTHDVTGYASANVQVPNSYSQSDEGKVVSNGALVAQTTDTVTANDTYDTTLINSLTVNVSGGSGWTTDGIANGTEPSGQIVVTVNNIVPYGFSRKTELTGITADSVTTLNQSICTDCSKLVSVSFANATSINGTQQFVNCTKLANVNLPKLTAVNNQTFQGCSSLEFIDLPKVTAFNRSGLFRNCYKLSTVVLRHTSVVAINNDTFANTPLAGYDGLTGTVYCPQSLISSYQQASNWSSLYSSGYCTFVKIEGSIYE